MCGICGCFDMKYQNRIIDQDIRKMVDVLRHRGPDDTNVYTDTSIGLGFARLSIIGIDNGMQPIWNENNSLIMICNGEIFNYVELKSELIKKGHHFKTYTDVEVILHLYEEYKEDCLYRLNGQFAFVIYDCTKKQIFAARDYVGIAPFFYTIHDNMFIFSSEIKGILENKSIERRLNLNALDQLVTFPGVISPNTMFKDIYSLEAGHYLIVNEEKILNCEYWDLVFYKDKTEEKSEQQYIEELDALLDESVCLRLNADVPVGFYVSGGLDSSLIAAKINKLKEGTKNAFSVYFDDKTISELRYQEMICEFLNINHYKRKIDIYDIAENLKNVIYFSETPLKETYNTASYLLSAMVGQQKTKVVLTGEGADELFAGYIGYSFDLLRQQNISDVSMDIDIEKKIRKTLWNNESFVYEKNYTSYEQIKKSLYSEALVNIYDSFCCHKAPMVDFKKTDGLSVTQLRSYVDFKLRLSDHLLSDHGDRMAYANSIEARYPFLDKNIIEFAAKLPDNMKIRDHVEKIILKKIGENILPPKIVNRPKFSFVAPGSVDLLRLNHEYINDMLNLDRIKRMGIFNPQEIESLKCKYLKEGFKLNLPFENDLLIIVLTLNIFMDLFKVTL